MNVFFRQVERLEVTALPQARRYLLYIGEMLSSDHINSSIDINVQPDKR